MAKNLSDYTEIQFAVFINEIHSANKSASDEKLGQLLQQFRTITEHPSGTDLIFYPEDGADDSPEGIVQTIKEWRKANGLPGFKPRF